MCQLAAIVRRTNSTSSRRSIQRAQNPCGRTRKARAPRHGVPMYKRPATGAAALVLASALGFAVAGAATTLGNLPLTFEVNRGQVEERVLFRARSTDYQVLLTADGATISLDDPGGSDSP